jgi:hypothetical protein
MVDPALKEKAVGREIKFDEKPKMARRKARAKRFTGCPLDTSEQRRPNEKNDVVAQSASDY